MGYGPLEEALLAKNQTIKNLSESVFFEIAATIENTKQLSCCLNGFGSGIKIIEPVALRKEFKTNSRELNALCKK